jgi:ATP-dependent RNA helicase RhlE
MEFMSQLSFSDLQLLPALQQALKETGYETPTPIQQQAIPIILHGQDLLGIAQTGTGKTAAFCLPILQNLVAKPIKREPRCARVLVLTPTRELAIQIHKSFQTYGKHLKLKYSSIFGGVGQRVQVHELSQGVDVLIATPGRLLDLLSQKYVRLDKIETFVLDEADRMLDMGFLKDVKKIIPLMHGKRHNLFFSATMPPEIQKLSQTILKNHKTVEVTPPSTTVEKIKQSVMYVDTKEKMNLLVHLLKIHSMRKFLVFVEMKHFANRVVEKLEANSIGSSAIHGNKSQGARQKALEDFSKDRIRVLVATDIASRGIDIDGITHVINFELPHVAENYVHRIGRTARAGAAGSAITFCSGDEKSFWVEIEKVTRQKVDVITDQPYHSASAMNAQTVSVGKAKAKIEGQRRKSPRREGGEPSRGFRRGFKKRRRS